MQTKLFLAFLPLLGLFIGCRGDDDDSIAPTECEAGLISVEEFAAQDTLTYTELNSTGLFYFIADSGDVNRRPVLTDRIAANYVGYITNGREFERTTPAGGPANFRLSEVIQGWQLGLPLIGEGGAIRLLIPAELAYGSTGSCRGGRCSICPDSDILFDIELVEILD